MQIPMGFVEAGEGFHWKLSQSRIAQGSIYWVSTVFSKSHAEGGKAKSLLFMDYIKRYPFSHVCFVKRGKSRSSCGSVTEWLENGTWASVNLTYCLQITMQSLFPRVLGMFKYACGT